jgi:hypothetical protein
MEKRAQIKRHKKSLNKSDNIEIKKSNKNSDKPLTGINDADDVIEASINKADDILSDIKSRIHDDLTFAEMKDCDKLDIYQDKYKEFYNAYPIVCRYMVCLGQYSKKAFRKFLLKCKNVRHSSENRMDKDYMADQWVMRQSDYIRFLWEDYQKGHYNTKESHGVWSHAYATLTKEFKDFKLQEKNIETQLNIDNKNNKCELVKELVSRISNNEQKIDENSINELLLILKDQSYRQNKKKVLAQIKEDIIKIPSIRQCVL